MKLSRIKDYLKKKIFLQNISAHYSGLKDILFKNFTNCKYMRESNIVKILLIKYTFVIVFKQIQEKNP